MSPAETVAARLRTHQAHQLTMTGTTFPYIDRMHFAAVPDPVKRRYSLYAGLWLMRPGDLVFFFQSAPLMNPSKEYPHREMIRGLRGVYEMAGEWQRGPARTDCPIGRDFPIYGSCPDCEPAITHTVQRDGDGKRLCQRGHDPQQGHDGTGEYAATLLLGLMCPIEPLFVFRNVVPQNVAYGDRTEAPMLWTGRHDNAMGRGKGSTVRHLLPEEATKITRLLIRENGEPNEAGESHAGMQFTPARDERDQPLQRPMVKRVATVAEIIDGGELSLNAQQSSQARLPQSALRTLTDAFGNERALSFEMAISEVPVGYTNTSPDFALCYIDPDQSHRLVVLIENKRDKINFAAVGQLHNYIPWIAQMFSNEGRIKRLTVVPILCGARSTGNLKAAAQYDFAIQMNDGSVSIAVEPMRLWHYRVSGPREIVDGVEYGDHLMWDDRSELLKHRKQDAARLTSCSDADAEETGKSIRDA